MVSVCHINKESFNSMFHKFARMPSLMYVHERLRHISINKLKHINGVGCDGNRSIQCELFHLTKQPRLPFHVSHSLSLRPFDLIHVNI